MGAMRSLIRADAGDERCGELHFGIIAAQRYRLFDQRVAVEIGRLFTTAVDISLLPRFEEEAGVEQLQRIGFLARRLKRGLLAIAHERSEEHTSELQSLRH